MGKTNKDRRIILPDEEHAAEKSKRHNHQKEKRMDRALKTLDIDALEQLEDWED